MTNKPKAKGTAYETALVKYLRTRLLDDRIERRALHGNQDLGDIFGIRAHGYEGIAEAKAHAKVTPALIWEWRGQTLSERDNADADFGLLVIKNPNKPIAQSTVHVTIRDLSRICPLIQLGMRDDWCDDEWVQMTLDEACRHIGGEYFY